MFRLAEHQTTVRTEVMAGLTTFLTMAYIIFVQPAVLGGAGMDFGAVTTATCIAAAVATLVMGLVANYPIGLAPGMGQNFFFVGACTVGIASVAEQQGWESEPWQVGLGVIFIAGYLFFLLSVLGVREKIVNAVSPSMKNAIAAGIGLFIAFIGLQHAGLIIDAPGSLVTLNTTFYSPDILIFFVGVIVITVLHTMGIRGSILWGIITATALAAGLKMGLGHFEWAADSVVSQSVLMSDFTMASSVFAKPPSLEPTALRMDLVHAIALPMIPYIVLFLFMDVFDTIGTLIGVTEQAGLVKDNKLPRAGRAMLADAVGTVLGAALGTSTVTSYIESAAGVEQGGRTGLTAVVVALGFIAALFFAPVIAMVGSYPVITAPALVVVGAMMMRSITRIDWDDYSESIPAFLIVVGIPLCFNIGDGLAIGFIAYPIVKILSGRGKQTGWISIALAAVLLAYFILVRARM